jgi:hypothetical protein
VKRRFLWLLAIFGLVWLYLRKGGRRPQPVVEVPPPADDPAEELRRKLDETKERVPEPSPAEEGPAAGQTSQPLVTDDLDAKRRVVHERARAASEEMRDSSTD